MSSLFFSYCKERTPFRFPMILLLLVTVIWWLQDLLWQSMTYILLLSSACVLTCTILDFLTDLRTCRRIRRCLFKLFQAAAEVSDCRHLVIPLFQCAFQNIGYGVVIFYDQYMIHASSKHGCVLRQDQMQRWGPVSSRAYTDQSERTRINKTGRSGKTSGPLESVLRGPESACFPQWPPPSYHPDEMSVS